MKRARIAGSFFIAKKTWVKVFSRSLLLPSLWIFQIHIEAQKLEILCKIWYNNTCTQYFFDGGYFNMKRFLPVVAFVAVAFVLSISLGFGVTELIKYVTPGILCPDLPEGGIEEMAVTHSALPPKDGSVMYWVSQIGQTFRGENSPLGGEEVYLRPELDNDGNPVGFRKVNNLEPAEPGKPRHTTIWENTTTQKQYQEKKDIFGDIVLSQL
jgi:hypothetical protein